MNKLTKLLSVFLVAGAVGASVAGVSGCKKKKGNSGHTHNYTWVNDNNGETCHEHCSADGCPEPDKASQNHVWGDDNVCDNCGATKSGGGDEHTTHTWSEGYTSDGESGHHKTTTCPEHAPIAGETEPHVYDDDNDATCNYCDYVREVGGGDNPDEPSKTIYETLMEREDKLAVLDSKYTVGSKLADYTDSLTKGIYFKYQESASDKYNATRDYVDVVQDGDGVALQQHGSDGVTGMPNVFTEIVVGPVSTKLEGYFETKMNLLTASGQTPIVFYSNGSAVLSIKADGGDKNSSNLSYKVGNAADFTAISGATMGLNTYIKVHFIFDFATGKTTLKIDDTVVLNEVETGITYVARIELASSNKGQRQHTTKNIVVCGSEMTAAEYKPVALANLDKEYAKYTFEDSLAEDGVTVIKATHSLNAEEVKETYQLHRGQISAQSTIADINLRYNNAIDALRAILSDVGVIEARAAAVDEVGKAFPSENYTFENLTGDDAKYNNKAAYEAAYNSAVAYINTLTDGALINSYINMNLHDDMMSPFKDVKANDKMISDKMDEVNTILETYGNDRIEQLDTTIDGVTEIIAAIRELQELGVGKSYSDVDDGIIILSWGDDDIEIEGDDDVGNYSTIAEVNAAFERVKADIDELIQQASETPAQTMTRLQGELATYATAAKVGITDTAVTDAIDAAAQAGNAAIGNVDENAADAQEQAQNAYKAATDAIDLILSKHEAKQEVKAYGETKKAEISEEATEALAAIDNIDISAIDAAEDKTAVEAATATVKAAIDRIVTDLLNSLVQVTIDGMDTVINVKYGSTLTKANMYVTAMNVTAVYTDSAKTQALPDEGVAVYSARTVYVDVEDIEGLVTSASWNAVSESNDTELFNVGLPATAVKLTNGDTNGTKTFAGTTLNGVTYETVYTLGNIPTGENNQATPLTIEVKSALSSLTILTRVAESSGDKARAGKTYYYVNGVLVKTANTVEAYEPLTGLNAGDVVTVWAENTGSGGHFYVCGVDATLDTSKAPKLVTVEWLNGDGTVWKTTRHSYCEVIVAPEGSPEVNGAHTGWLYDGSDLPDDLKLASGSKVQMSPKVETPDITINYTDGGKTESLSYLSTAADNELPAHENGDATHLFLGYYLQGTDEPFDLSTAGAGTYNVYAHYMEANLHLVYKVNADDAGETVHLFKKSGSEVVDKDGNAAELKGAPEAPDSALPQFDGWYYVPEGGTETKLTNIADLVASETSYILVAHWKEAKVYQEYLYSTATSTVSNSTKISADDSYVANDVIIAESDTNLFSMKATGTLTAGTVTKALTLNGDTTIAANTGYALKTGSIARSSTANLVSITAGSKDIKVTLYIVSGKASSIDTQRKTEIYNGTTSLFMFGDSAYSKVVVPIELTIKAGETADISVKSNETKNDDSVICIYGVVAETV